MGTRYYPISPNFLSSARERTRVEGNERERESERKKGSVIDVILIRINRISSCMKPNEENRKQKKQLNMQLMKK